MLLDGPYDSGIQLMRDTLRSLAGFPLTEPYSALGLPPTAGTGTISPAVLTVAGPDAIVDWVMVELRDAAVGDVVLVRRPALLQRDGDVVALGGAGPLLLPALPGPYHVAVRHRNHLGVMNALPVALSDLPTTVDLTLPATATFGAGARKPDGAVMLLWAGDASSDGQLKYTGGGNDRDTILLAIGGNAPTATLNGQYRSEDVTMDGLVKYTGAANDRDCVLVNVGGTLPTATRDTQLP